MLPGRENSFEEMTKEDLWAFLFNQREKIIDLGQITKQQRRWLDMWAKEGKIRKYKGGPYSKLKMCFEAPPLHKLMIELEFNEDVLVRLHQIAKKRGISLAGLIENEMELLTLNNEGD